MEANQPSKENPIHAGSILVYPDGFVYDKKFIELKEIKLISFYWVKEFINAGKSGARMEMTILLNNSNDIIESKISTFHRHDSEKFDIFYNAYEYLAASTFKQRFDLYIEEYNKNGFIVYDHKKIYKSGRVDWLGTELNINESNVFKAPFSIEIVGSKIKKNGKKGCNIQISIETNDDQDVFFELLKKVYGINLN